MYFRKVIDEEKRHSDQIMKIDKTFDFPIDQPTNVKSVIINDLPNIDYENKIVIDVVENEIINASIVTDISSM